MRTPNSRHLSVLALCALGLVLAGCGSVDKGAAIRADESLYARVVRVPGLSLRSRDEIKLTGGGFSDSTIGEHTTGWNLAYTFNSQPSIADVYLFVRMHLPADWTCLSATDMDPAYNTPGGICLSADRSRFVDIGQGFHSVAHKNSTTNTPLPHTVRIEVGFNYDPGIYGTEYPAHGHAHA
jgi:hypothetical protein